MDTRIQNLKARYGERDAGQWTEHDFISPIVLLLKLANERRSIVFDEERNDWGRLWSIREYLQSLKLKKHTAEEESCWPGIPGCILSIVPVWTSHQIVISASNDRFLVNKALYKKGRASRIAHLSRMQADCTAAVQERITNFMSCSNKFKQIYEASKKVHIYEHDIAAWKRESGLSRIHLPGVVATWTPLGIYKPACLLDYCRFHILRPPKAEETEQKCWWEKARKRVTDKQVWETETCAEWAAFLELASVSTATVTEATQW